MNWKPPFYLFFAGQGTASDSSYYNKISEGSPETRRLLITHTLSGSGTLYVKGKRMKLHEEDIFVIERPGPYIYCFEKDDSEWHFEFVSICYSNTGGLLPEEYLDSPVLSLKNHPDLKRRIQELIRIRNRPDYQDQLLDSAKAYSVFLSYIKARESEKQSAGNPIAEDLKKYIIRNNCKDFNLGKYSRESGYAQETICRTFSKTYGIAPLQYVMQLKLEKACRLLENSRKSIKEISSDCAFSSQNYFSRIFRKHFGISPGEYRLNPAPFQNKTL